MSAYASKVAAATLVALLCQCAATPSACANLLANPDFEISEVTGGAWPTTTYDWDGDQSQIVFGPSGGVTPFNGQGMLEFQGTTNTGAGLVASQVIQFVPVTGSMIGSPATLSAWFNRDLLPGAIDDDAFFVIIQPHTGSPASWPNPLGPSASNVLFSNANPNDWEQVSTTLASIPAGATYLEIQISANENVFDDSTPPEFYAGHFADGVVLTVPEPSTVALGLMGLFGLAGLLVHRRRTVG